MEMPPPLSRTVQIVNLKGLHARAAAKFVKTSESFDAIVTVQRREMLAGGSSIMGLMMLGAAKGSELLLCASGAEAEQALDALEALIANKFGEEE